MLTTNAHIFGFYKPLTDYPSKETMLTVANFIKPKFLCFFFAWLSLGALVMFKKCVNNYHDRLDCKNDKNN